ncbi:MAG: hydrogenase iron-sulfur subunit [Promethearchaeota archaeon]
MNQQIESQQTQNLEGTEAASSFEPKVVGFLCNWCSYAGADLAGSLHKEYPTNIRIIRVMCTGRVTAQMVLDAFSMGADGVLVSGCHFGDCHYRAGNYRANRMAALTHKLMEQLGVDPARFVFTMVSASEAVKFSQVVNKFVEDLKDMGPLKLV